MAQEMSSTNGIGRLTGSEAGVHVLLVDDDETWVSSTAQILESQREEFTVRTATDLASAAAAFDDHDPDCVVCDYELDTGTGLELLAAVREESDRPFILITGQGSEAVASEAIGKQVTDYIPKRSLGGRDDLLARRIETAVETYRTERALARERQSKEAMLDILRATSSRDGVAREFCEHLVRERDYACAWIGTVDQSRDVVPRTVAGDERYVDAVIAPGVTPESSTEPALVTLARREPHVVTSIGAESSAPTSRVTSSAASTRAESTADDWRAVATSHGFESAAAIPIDHERTTFGVLAVYKTSPELGPGEKTLLSEYGKTIGYALRSAEWKESLLSTAPVSIEIEVDSEAAPLVAVDNRLPDGTRLDVLTTALRENSLLYVLRITGTSATHVQERATEVESVESVTIIQSGDPIRCELVTATPTPETVLMERGGRIVNVSVERGRASIRTVCPGGDDVRPLVDVVQSTYPDAGVRSVRSTDAVERQVTADDLLGSLTERQRQAIEVAFYNGYFERPRDHNTTDVAEKLGVSRQTLTQHLRAGERHLLSGLFESSEHHRRE